MTSALTNAGTLNEMQEIQDSFLRLFNGCRLNEKKQQGKARVKQCPDQLKLFQLLL